MFYWLFFIIFIWFGEKRLIWGCLDLHLWKNELIFYVRTHLLWKWTCIVGVWTYILSILTYMWCLNLYFVKIDLYLVSELILLGKGTWAQMGPRPKLGPDPEPFRGGFLGKNWSREQNRHGHVFAYFYVCWEMSFKVAMWIQCHNWASKWIPIGPPKGIEVRVFY